MRASYIFIFSLLYGTPAPSSESQLLEAWPASHYGHLREAADLLRMCRESQLVAANSHFEHLLAV